MKGLESEALVPLAMMAMIAAGAVLAGASDVLSWHGSAGSWFGIGSGAGFLLVAVCVLLRRGAPK